jgi:hypothetical protein
MCVYYSLLKTQLYFLNLLYKSYSNVSRIKFEEEKLIIRQLVNAHHPLKKIYGA